MAVDIHLRPRSRTFVLHLLKRELREKGRITRMGLSEQFVFWRLIGLLV